MKFFDKIFIVLVYILLAIFAAATGAAIVSTTAPQYITILSVSIIGLFWLLCYFLGELRERPDR